MRNGVRKAAAVATAASLLLLGSACGDGGDGGGGDGASESPREHPESSTKARTVSARSHGEFGKILTGGQDKTLYLFEKDKSPKSTCSGACAQAWPPMIVKGRPTAGEGGVRKDLLGTSKRSDGKMQVTYGGWPLYHFVRDKAPGDTNGQDVEGFGAEWYLVSPSGEEVED